MDVSVKEYIHYYDEGTPFQAKIGIGTSFDLTVFDDPITLFGIFLLLIIC